VRDRTQELKVFGSDRGGETAAICISILASARRHGIEPFAYVRQLLIALSSADVDLRTLLPDVWIAAHPEHFLQYRRDEAEAAARARKRRREKRRAKSKARSLQVEVMHRPELIGRLDQRNQRLLTGQGSWPVNGHTGRTVWPWPRAGDDLPEGE
jgi:hypothetical protein